MFTFSRHLKLSQTDYTNFGKLQFPFMKNFVIDLDKFTCFFESAPIFSFYHLKSTGNGIPL